MNEEKCRFRNKCYILESEECYHKMDEDYIDCVVYRYYESLLEREKFKTIISQLNEDYSVFRQAELEEKPKNE